MVSTAYTVNVLQHTLLSHIVTLFFCFYQFDLTEHSSLYAPASSVDSSHHHRSTCQPLNLSHCQCQNHLIWQQCMHSQKLSCKSLQNLISRASNSLLPSSDSYDLRMKVSKYGTF